MNKNIILIFLLFFLSCNNDLFNSGLDSIVTTSRDYLQSYAQEQEIDSPGTTATTSFSKDALAISADGNVLAVGELFAKKLYIYTKSQGAFSDYITINSSDDGFARSVAISADGNTIVVGANGATVGSNSGQGVLYVYTKNGSSWDEEQIVVSAGSSNDMFGNMVGISGDGNTIASGAIGYGNYTGAAYVCKKSGGVWSEPSLVSTGSAISEFHTVGILPLTYDGNTLIVDSQNINSSKGEVYIYTYSSGSWSKVQTLTASDAASGDLFSPSVISADGGIIVVSAQAKNSNTGAAYIFERSGSSWSFVQKITASDGVSGDNFGSTLVISRDGGTVVVGTYNSGSVYGKAYVYKISNDEWFQFQKLSAADSSVNDYFGYTITIDTAGDNIVVGAHGANSNDGAAYFFN